MRSNYPFNAGIMDQDSDPRLVAKNQYIEAINCSVGDLGKVTKNPGTEILAFEIVPDGYSVIGSKIYEDYIYYFATNGTLSLIGRYNIQTREVATLVVSSRLNFSTDNPINFINFVDDELNGKFFVYWTDGLNQPKRMEVNDVLSRPSDFILVDRR